MQSRELPLRHGLDDPVTRAVEPATTRAAEVQVLMAGELEADDVRADVDLRQLHRRRPDGASIDVDLGPAGPRVDVERAVSLLVGAGVAAGFDGGELGGLGRDARLVLGRGVLVASRARETLTSPRLSSADSATDAF